jgi:anti-sigma B factor antagonist
MSIETRKKGNITILKLSGQLTLGTACDRLRDEFRTALDKGDRHFVFDMLNVPFVDSSGVGEVIRCHKRAKDESGLIQLVLQGKSQELFIFWELHKLFTIFDDVESAIASFAK